MAAAQSDAFRDRLAEAQAATGRPELARQSVGRAVTEAEKALATAMMEFYGAGATTLAEVAEKLTERGVTAPASGGTTWDAATMEAELKAANANLDDSYQTNGYGA
jgi:hypothetical protein